MPTADFSGVPLNGTSPLTVNFTDNSTAYDLPLTYEWDFGDGEAGKSTLQNPSYIYNSPGTYTVILKVTDSDGSTDTLIKTGYITVAVPVYTLTVSSDGSGRVLSSPSGIDCGGDCTETYEENTLVTLTAEPDEGWIFIGWSGACSGAGTCQVIMNTDRNVTAAFTELTVFADNFNWDQIKGTWASEKIEETGEIVYVEKSTSKKKPAFSLVDITTQDMTIEVKANDQGEGSYQNFFIVFAYDEANKTAYLAGARADDDQWTIEQRNIKGSGKKLAYIPETVNAGTWYDLKVVVSGNTVTLYADGVEKLSYTFSSGIPSGRIGLGGINNQAYFDDYIVTY